jgi:phage baseplate assembly protein W
MATNPGSINLKFPLTKFRKGFFEGNQTTLAATREDIKTLLLTRKGERVINPGLGTNIPIFAGELFNQIQPAEMKIRMSNEIKAALSDWMPHVELINLRVITYDDDSSLMATQIRVEMDYRLTNAEALTDSIQLNING